ncbi:uncharacterized protein LOC141620385 [Silene latifolia]|uniref:uncharacterized protein LOC141620385 n=1 Tax=Silene latifolia TaxID=37657 RepID=UPI003D77ACAC
MSPLERLGGNTTEAEMEHFQECVSFCGWEDIQATGTLFTWSNKQDPTDRVYSRLNRAMGNQEWIDLFGDYVAHFHPEGLFDHCPCTMVYKRAEIGGRKSFKYFNMWGTADIFKDSVEIRTIPILLVQCWNNSQERVDKPGNMNLIQQEMDLAYGLKELISVRDSFLTQKVKLQWSLEGDLNTSYFHHAIKNRMTFNKVF